MGLISTSHPIDRVTVLLQAGSQRRAQHAVVLNQ
jgi:hypothetical protein